MARILVIDDQQLVRYTVRALLKSAGHDVVEAGNGSEGIALCKAQAIDLVITDIVMPEKEGIETIIELRKTHPELKIVAMSGGGRIAGTEYLKLAESLGVEGVLHKPFQTQEILDLVRRILG